MCQKIVEDWDLDVTANETNPCLTYLGFKVIDKTVIFGLIKYEQNISCINWGEVSCIVKVFLQNYLKAVNFFKTIVDWLFVLNEISIR